MAQAQAFVFDAYGTLFDVRSVLAPVKKSSQVTAPPDDPLAHQATRIHLAAFADGPV